MYYDHPLKSLFVMAVKKVLQLNKIIIKLKNRYFLPQIYDLNKNKQRYKAFILLLYF